MSIQLIQQYHAQVEKIIRYGGTRKETAVRKPFHDLLEHCAWQKLGDSGKIKGNAHILVYPRKSIGKKI